MELNEIIKKLVGEIKPIGESTEDTQRFGNLTVMCDLIVKLVDEVYEVAENKNRTEHSMKLAGIFADRFLSEVISPTTNFRLAEYPPTEMSDITFDFEEGEVQVTKECLIKPEDDPVQIGYYVPSLNKWVDRDTFEIPNVALWVYLDEIAN